MMEAYSPQREDGSPLHSPHRLRHYDSHLAIGEIQRSLSRSPSKPSDYRSNALRSNSPSFGAIPFHSSPLSPSRKAASDFFLSASAANTPLGGRTSTSRSHRPAMRRTAQTTSALRTRTSPKSPSKRVLSDSSSSGNASPMPLRKRSSTEADREQGLKGDVNMDKENSLYDENLASRQVYTRQEKRRSGGSMMNFFPPNSPMKRPETAMAIDEDDFPTPSAKRRSLHAGGLDFSIFESDSLGQEVNENRSQDDNDWLRQGSPAPSSRFSTIPKRSSSLRKSTLQQRQSDRPSHMKFNEPLDFNSSWFDATPAAKNNKGLRMSLDNHIDPLPRDSPFSAQGNLLNASIHPTSSVQPSQSSQVQQGRHPLARTMTQSSSTSSVQDESPTHEPVHRPTRPRSYDFAKSLPVGTTRPSPDDGSGFSSQGSFATPGNYKSAKPLPAAFMSTGLISKKNRNVDEPNGGLPKSHMPDTPCKKQSIMFPAPANFNPRKSLVGQAVRQSFGTPASPAVDSTLNFSKPLPFGRSVGLFGPRPSRPSMMRKTSFASIESEEKASSQSPNHQQGSQSTDGDFPPTPTKYTESPFRKSSISPSPHGNRMVSVPQFTAGAGSGTHFPSCKLSPIQASPESNEGDSDSVMEDSPSANLRPRKSLLNVVVAPGSSFTQGRLLKHLNSPTPLSRKALAVPAAQSPVLERTKIKSSPVTPQAEKLDRYSPRTPLENCFPPDPSSLSISGHGDRPSTRQGPTQAVPATPTGPREYFPNFSNRPSLNLNSADLANVDDSLTSRFEKVELVGTGEFSQVYRVSQPPTASPYHKIYSVSSPRPARNAQPARVWAVKKSRYRYTGPKDRQNKLQEVSVLRALGRADHVITFVDSWEHEGNLYIQTEFCEEGTLDVFLSQMGRKARLDDFRIWKILLELSMGLKYIHQSGFIHLDLKPANVLITFEGILKIGDFGMATKWPAKAGIEGEGDREYIGPEILMGSYDKPADIFALGLMMLETAGNVELPDNGASWQKLRNGDMSDVPSLTWSSENSSIARDASGNPISQPEMTEVDVDAMDSDHGNTPRGNHKSPPMLPRNGELVIPPTFMVDAADAHALDQTVRWMISPNPTDRPLASDVLMTGGVRFVQFRRRAGATVYEGNWGPADSVLAEDAEMLDV